ncbi:hypothetical protein QTO34_019220 [Cnephaeus nilssonii]|uniref:Uncharacterized protein n=1 Tax=Cnephaeus nilssonii TaxID=3371016 RepID=A0AA40LNR5_CNENI|nr:hypothetical protein QTO34_019220 [Eptesicus nilssonii]
MGVSKYGIKVSASGQYDVLHRHTLYLITRMTTAASSEEVSLWVYQCSGLEPAQAICKVLSTASDSVLTAEKA